MTEDSGTDTGIGPEVLREAILSSYISSAPTTASYTGRAIGSMIAKIIFMLGDKERTNFGRLKELLESSLGRESIPDNVFRLGLNYLEQQGWARRRKTKDWRLSPEGYSAIESDISESDSLSTEILDRYFPARIPRTGLRQCFVQLCVEYFATFPGSAASTIPIDSEPEDALPLEPYLCQKVCESNGLAEHADLIEEGFNRFFKSTDEQERAFRFSLWQCHFAARLLVSHSTSDTILVDSIRDSTLVLDTSVLSSINFAPSDQQSAFSQLALTLSELNVQIVYFPVTEDEYERFSVPVFDALRKVGGIVANSVLEKTNDGITTAALHAGSVTPEDFKNFVESNSAPPAVLGDALQITLLDDDHLNRVGDDALKDQNLSRWVETAWSGLYPNRRGKRPRAVEHDASLTAIVDQMKNDGTSVWVLTYDRSMQMASYERTTDHELPDWITLESLVRLLVSNNGTVDNAGNEVANLLNLVLDSELAPVRGTFSVLDLAQAIEVENQIADLPDESVEEIATKVTKARLSPDPKTESDLAVVITQSFQYEKLRYDERVDSAEVGKREAEKAARDAGRQLVSAETLLVDERAITLRSRARTKIIIGACLVIIGIALVAGGVVAHVVQKDAFYPANTMQGLGNAAFLLGGILLTSGLTVLWRGALKFKSAKDEATEYARESLDDSN